MPAKSRKRRRPEIADLPSELPQGTGEDDVEFDLNQKYAAFIISVLSLNQP